jgi:hypothetical protein
MIKGKCVDDGILLINVDDEVIPLVVFCHVELS